MDKRVVDKVKRANAQGPRKLRPAGERELLFYGQHICEKLSEQRRGDIIRVYCTEENVGRLGPLLRWCAQNRIAYHVVSEADLQRITQAVHHEGVAILARNEAPRSSKALLAAIDRKAFPLLVLDGVQNPHNIGTIMRVMASFGWPALVGGPDLPPLTAAAARMSEGGAEFVKTFTCSRLVDLLKELKLRGYRVVGTSSHVKASLYQSALPEKLVFVLGAEIHGISEEVERCLDELRVIPTTGQVESLNVAVASGLLLGEYTRIYGLVQNTNELLAVPVKGS